ncbi:hypothetical protein Tsubulata_010381 [Turnera subulata]|uniref:Protein GAMETE EXPRESSED 1 n=1 Tax=Turnera subulata TaxID=218843 RepID=A0A9Q0JHG9_9ROSI|nr:hypothetical protein Tsubulata_010381 [Turnera subulata]
MGYYSQILVLLILVLSSPRCQSWGWFSSSTERDPNDQPSQTDRMIGGSVAEFSMDGLGDEKGMKLVEKAKSKIVGSNSCWQNAYQQLFAGCSQILAAEEKRSRFAWHLSDCFQKESGRPRFPSCDVKSAMLSCLKKLNDNEHKIYLEFLLETNSICYQLQAHTFKHKMERLVNELKTSAEDVEDRLETMQDRTDSLLKNSVQIHDSLSSIDLRVESVAESTKDVKAHMDSLSQQSEDIYKQSRNIALAQAELEEGQANMSNNFKEGMTMIHDAYSNLGQQVDNLRHETVEIEKEIGRVGEAMSSKMKNLQNSANDIENIAGQSLNKQQLLLDGQSTALEGLQHLTKSQSEALLESRNTLQQLAEYGRQQQEELLQRQEQLQRVHDHLVENSKSILAAQEAFELKQASMFIALDKLFALHNTMLLESRIFKALLIYSLSIFAIYMFTSTKQTYNVRLRLYLGLGATMALEVAILHLTTNNIEQRTWLIDSVRSLFLVAASIQYVYAILTYRDYDLLNHQMLLTMNEKFNAMLQNKQLPWEASENRVNWSSWIEADLTEDDDELEDLDFIVPEEVGENSITTSSTTKMYDLRHRRH